MQDQFSHGIDARVPVELAADAISGDVFSGA